MRERQLIGAEEVAAAIADVGEGEGGAAGDCGDLKQKGDERGAHALHLGKPARLLEDGLVGGMDGGVEAGVGRGGARRFALHRRKLPQKSLAGEAAGDVAGGGSAHAVAHREGSEDTGLGGGGAGILVALADAAGVREHGEAEAFRGHGCCKKCAGENCTRPSCARPSTCTGTAVTGGRNDLNRIVHGENLLVLRGLAAGSFELIYVDPPFNTGRRQVRPRMTTVRDADGDRTGFGGVRYRTVKDDAPLAGVSGSRSMITWDFCGRGWRRRDAC